MSKMMWEVRGELWGERPLYPTLPFCRSVSQNSSILPEEEDEKSCTESELRVCRRKSPARLEEVSVLCAPG